DRVATGAGAAERPVPRRLGILADRSAADRRPADVRNGGAHGAARLPDAARRARRSRRDPEGRPRAGRARLVGLVSVRPPAAGAAIETTKTSRTTHTCGDCPSARNAM